MKLNEYEQMFGKCLERNFDDWKTSLTFELNNSKDGNS